MIFQATIRASSSLSICFSRPRGIPQRRGEERGGSVYRVKCSRDGGSHKPYLLTYLLTYSYSPRSERRRKRVVVFVIAPFIRSQVHSLKVISVFLDTLGRVILSVIPGHLNNYIPIRPDIFNAGRILGQKKWPDCTEVNGGACMDGRDRRPGV